MRPCRQNANAYAGLKAIMDVVLAAALMALTAPLVIVAAAVVKLTSPSPASYSQTRLGLGGRRYTLYKTRTMRHNCERLTGHAGPSLATRVPRWWAGYSAGPT